MNDDFWELVCAFQTFYLVGVIIVFVLGTLSLLAYPTADPGSATRGIIQINVIIQVVLLAAFGGLYLWCRRMEEDERRW